MSDCETFDNYFTRAQNLLLKTGSGRTGMADLK